MREVRVHGIGADARHGASLVLLQGAGQDRRVLLIRIGDTEAGTLIAARWAAAPGRDTHPQIIQVVHGVGKRVTSVVITDVVGDDVHAELVVEDGPRIDARPGDALVIAVRLGVGVGVADAVLDAAAVPTTAVVECPDREGDPVDPSRGGLSDDDAWTTLSSAPVPDPDQALARLRWLLDTASPVGRRRALTAGRWFERRTRTPSALGVGQMSAHRPQETDSVAAGRSSAGSHRQVDQATGLLMGAFALDVRTATAVLAWLARRTDVTVGVVASRFLDAAHGVDIGAAPRGQARSCAH